MRVIVPHRIISSGSIPPTAINESRAASIKTYEDEDARYCCLTGVLPEDAGAPRETQALQCFERMEAELESAGMCMRNVVRTWLYLDDLLEWYDNFNCVRTEFFRERGLFSHLVPASTGIGAANPFGTAIIAGAIAIRPKTDRVRAFAVQSPMQCPALDYQSSFSRAVEVTRPGERQLLISGTASISADGRSLHVDDPLGQIELTMQVVHAILRSRRMNWANSTRAIAYFRRAADINLFESWLERNRLSDLPVMMMEATICRQELLFELELDAAAS